MEGGGGQRKTRGKYKIVKETADDFKTEFTQVVFQTLEK